MRGLVQWEPYEYEYRSKCRPFMTRRAFRLSLASLHPRGTTTFASASFRFCLVNAATRAVMSELLNRLWLSAPCRVGEGRAARHVHGDDVALIQGGVIAAQPAAPRLSQHANDPQECASQSALLFSSRPLPLPAGRVEWVLRTRALRHPLCTRTQTTPPRHVPT